MSLALLASCTREQRPVVVWSDIAETAFIVELYNRDFDAAVHFRYVDNLTEALTQERLEADVVIGRWVNNPSVNGLMEPHTAYSYSWSAQTANRGRGARFAVRIPPALLEASPYWLPLSFNLPGLLFLPDGTDPRDRFSMTLDEIGERSARDEAPRVFFAPGSDPAATYAVHRSLGFHAAVDESGAPTWDAALLEETLATVRSWQRTWNGSRDDEARYTERYLYDPPRRQLDTARVGLIYLPSNLLFRWDFFDERRYDFAWLAGPEGRIAAEESIVYGGIPSGAEHLADAVRFLSWITTPDVQLSIITEKLVQRVDSFGILDGFSTIPEVNRAMAEEIYPELAGRIPHPEAVVVPRPLPRYWNEALAHVVAPYLVRSTEADGLESALGLWYRQRGD